MADSVLLLKGINLLRQSIGEEAVTHLVRSNVTERKAAWLELLRREEPEIREAVIYVLDGLGILEEFVD